MSFNIYKVTPNFRFFLISFSLNQLLEENIPFLEATIHNIDKNVTAILSIFDISFHLCFLLIFSLMQFFLAEFPPVFL